MGPQAALATSAALNNVIKVFIFIGFLISKSVVISSHSEFMIWYKHEPCQSDDSHLLDHGALNPWQKPRKSERTLIF